MNYKWRELAFPLLVRTANLLPKRWLRKIPFVRKMWNSLHSAAIPDYPVLFNINGIKLFANPNIHGVGWILLVQGVYEPGTVDLFMKLLTREGMVVVDLGANVGYFTMVAAKLVGNSGKVYAFEPEPSNFELLLRNIKLNGYTNVVPINKAVSNREGPGELFISNHRTSESQIFKRENGSEIVPIESTSLDIFFNDRDHHIDVIKMDIEGAEELALHGMSSVLKNNQHIKIITEFNPETLEKAGSSPKEYLTIFIELGFKLYRIDEERKSLENISSPEAEIEALNRRIFSHYENILITR